MQVRMLEMKLTEGYTPIGVALPGPRNVIIWTPKWRKPMETNAPTVSDLSEVHFPEGGTYRWGNVVEASDELRTRPHKIYEKALQQVPG